MQATSSCPSKARDSGFERAGSHLWLAPDAIYVVGPTATQRWPRVLTAVGCA